MEKYDIYVEGVKEFSSVDEEEMLDISQALADEFYHSDYQATEHPRKTFSTEEVFFCL